MAARVRAHDWSATPLGPLEGWTDRLKAIVELTLANPLVSSLTLLKDRLLIYNDAAAKLYGERHPAALGRPLREAFPDSYPAVADLYDRVFAGESVEVRGQSLSVSGVEDDEVFDASLTPVRTDNGAIIGAYMVGLEIGNRVRAEAALRDSEIRFRAFVTASSDIVYRMSPDWSEMRELNGQGLLADTSEPRALWLEQYINSDDQPGVQAAILQAIASKSLYELEHRVRRIDGTLGWILSRAAPILNDQGEIMEWLGSATDITPRKKVEAALRESEAKLAAAFESVPVGAAIIDMSGAAVISNTEYRRFLPTGVIPSRDLTHLARWRAWDPQGCPLEPKDFPGARALRGETVVPGQEMLHTNEEGREVWATVATTPIRDQDGRVTGAVTAIADVDGAKRSAEALRISEERLRGFGEASSDVLWIRSADTFQWEYLTPAFETIYGLDRATALSGDNMAGWVELILPEDRERAIASLRRVTQGERVTFEYRIRRPIDGQIRWLRNTDFPMRDPLGQVRWIGGVGRDVTDERRQAQRLAVLLAELQHRVRNTLAVVRSMVRRTAETSDTVDDFHMHLDGRINAFARVQASVTRDPSAGINLEHLAADEMLAYARPRGDQVSLAGPTVLLSPKSAETIGLAVHELATNAVKYGALGVHGGRVRFTWHLIEGERLVLDWRETGVHDLPPQPGRAGFGTFLLDQTLVYELEADVQRIYEPGGLHCIIELALSAVTPERDGLEPAVKAALDDVIRP